MTFSDSHHRPDAVIAPHPADDRAIRQLIQRASDAQSDRDALLALHRPDAVVVNFPGRRVLGADALGEAMSVALDSPLRDVITRVEVLDIRLINDQTALASCIKTVHDQRDNAGSLPASSGALTYVLARSGDGWQIVLAQTTPILA